MKTIDQIAEAAGVTKAAIYKRFQSYGLSVNQLRAEKQGRTKVYGEDIERLIILMFQPNGAVENSVENTADELHEEMQKIKGVADGLAVEIKTARTDKQRAEERAEKAEARAERAEAQTELLLQQIDKLTDAIRAAEAVQAAQISQIARIQGQTERRKGVLARLRERLKGGKGE